jgi:hypothetical protein
VRRGISSAIAVLLAGAMLAACGGDDDGGGEESSEPVTLESAQACLEDAGAKVERIEVSLIEPPADLRVEFPPDDDVTVWVEDSEDDIATLIESSNELNELGGGGSEGAEPPTQIGSAAYDPLAGAVSEETQTAVEGCLS